MCDNTIQTKRRKTNVRTYTYMYNTKLNKISNLISQIMVIKNNEKN